MDDGKARALVIGIIAVIAGVTWLVLNNEPLEAGRPTFIPVPTATTTAPAAGPSLSPQPSAEGTSVTPSSAATSVSPTADPLAAPADLKVESNTDRAVTLTWAPVNGATSYKVKVYESVIGETVSTRAIVLWGRSVRLQISVVPVGAAGVTGPEASITATRPPSITTPEPTTPPVVEPPVTPPVEPPEPVDPEPGE